MNCSRHHGFTLVEVLMVIGIMAALMAMSFALPTGFDAEGQVSRAAQELAATMRETRARAMRANAVYAISFHIQNAPGSSGRVLNNRSGGHWYRVIGPSEPRALTGKSDNPTEAIALGEFEREQWSQPPFYQTVNHLRSGRSNPGTDGNKSTMSVLRQWIEVVNRCWVGEAHRLPQGKVRFLALTDQDNGDNRWPSQGGYYSATYPRPWFGYWDTSSDPAYPQLRTWGGYDPALEQIAQTGLYTSGILNWVDGNAKLTITNTYSSTDKVMSHSGFYYEGYEGTITGCVNPADRLTYADTNLNGFGDAYVNAAPTDVPPVAATTYDVLMKKDDPRPLIDAHWLDFVIVFYPDGRVSTDWFRMRNLTGYKSYSGSTSHMFPRYNADTTMTWPVTHPPDANNTLADHNKRVLLSGVPDRCGSAGGAVNFFDPTSPYFGFSRLQREATDFVDRTGFYYLTIAPDTTNDDGRYAAPEKAIQDLQPLYRVGISPQGFVKVIKVRSTNYLGRTLDTSITGNDWHDPVKIRGGATFGAVPKPTANNYYNHELYDKDYKPIGAPVEDVLTSEMLTLRTWWWQ
jgi:prepilin-type N-terminal cleavage/methylation domain-containing protein